MEEIVSLETLKKFIQNEIPNQSMVGKLLLNSIIDDLKEKETVLKIQKMVEENPNDMLLGMEIRKLFVK